MCPPPPPTYRSSPRTRYCSEVLGNHHTSSAALDSAGLLERASVNMRMVTGSPAARGEEESGWKPRNTTVRARGEGAGGGVQVDKVT